VSCLFIIGFGFGILDFPCSWSPGKNPTNTVHVYDIAGGLWACAEWMASLGRTEADSLAGEEILFHNDKSKVAEVTGMPPHDQKLIVPLFNLVNAILSPFLVILAHTSHV
jgi:hypothetical protein